MKANTVKFLSVISVPLLVLAVVLAIIYFNSGNQAVFLPDYGKASPFKLTDSAGLNFESTSLFGRPWIASFIFTRCQNQTPRMVMGMKKLSERFPDLRFVSITVDPDYDKPEILTQFTKRGEGPHNWLFLTGTNAEINKSKEALRLSMPDSPGMHSTRFVMVDASGHIRGFYDSQSRQQMTELEADVQGLIENPDKVIAP